MSCIKEDINYYKMPKDDGTCKQETNQFWEHRLVLYYTTCRSGKQTIKKMTEWRWLNMKIRLKYIKRADGKQWIIRLSNRHSLHRLTRTTKPNRESWNIQRSGQGMKNVSLWIYLVGNSLHARWQHHVYTICSFHNKMVTSCLKLVLMLSEARSMLCDNQQMNNQLYTRDWSSNSNAFMNHLQIMI